MATIHLNRVHLGDVATWAGAIASFLAVATALFIALRPDRLRRRHRPRLHIELGEIEPYERAVMSGTQVHQYRLRIGVRNTGFSTARRVRVSIERWWSESHRPKPWIENPIDPALAQWVGHDVYGGPEAFSIDIAPGGRALCEVMTWNPNSKELTLTIHPRRQEWTPTTGGPYGEQRVSLSVSCENADGTHVVVSTTITSGTPEVGADNVSRRSPMHDVRIESEPCPDDVLHEGLLGLWTRATS
jgi:hypothetical protein